MAKKGKSFKPKGRGGKSTIFTKLFQDKAKRDRALEEAATGKKRKR